MKRTVEDLGAEVERRWGQLGAPVEASELKVIDLPQTVDAGTLFLGVAQDGSRLLVPLTADAHRSFKIDRKSRGVHLLLRHLEHEDGNRWYLDIVCLRPELRWLFSSFIADVLLRFERHPDVDPPALVRTCFSAWRALFVGGGPRMTVKQLAGLYGELHVLERMLGRNPKAVERWRGPLGESHDFVSVGLDAEVKTTLSSEDDVVHIHGIGQLSVPMGGQLRLAHLRVESPSPDGESLGEIIERISILDHSGRLPGLLAAAGYREAEHDAYSEVTFRLLAEMWFTVDSSFPRLDPESFPGGVVPDGLSDFRYTLDLSRITTPPLGAAAIEDTLAVLSK